MSKSILVIDAPESCVECRLMERDVDCIPEEYCKADKDEREIIEPNTKPDWCPLKEFPQKMVKENKYDEYADGYNACIDELLKECGEN